MEKKIAQNFVMTLNHEEFAPFLYFLTMASIPAELEDKWMSGPERIQCSLTLPMDFDPMVLMEIWQEWKTESLALDYAVLN